ncbi:patatin-like phospholipase family protein [Clostridium sp.]|uniref:patatin-like phospholipase family protein n=1 Tax=Clostridium sp. TaxID=1506 RepID=UPI002FC6A4AB
MKVDMVFEGGGVLGICFVGALTSLKQHGYEIERCAGTSAGAIMAALVVAGYTIEELYNIIGDTDFTTFQKASRYLKIPIPRTVQFISKNGIYNGNNIEDWIRPLLEAKGVTKFKHVMKNGNSRLRIIASDITKGDMLVLPEDLRKYGIDPGEFDIATAVRMSASIPFYFTPHILNHREGSSYIVDGGLLSNFPIWIFDVEGLPRWPTFGLRLEKIKEQHKSKKCNLYRFTKNVISAPIDINGERFIRDKDLIRTIIIKYKNISSTDFRKVNKYKDELFKLGYDYTEQFMNKWDFRRYLSTRTFNSK